MKHNKAFKSILKLVPFLMVILFAFSAGCVIPDVVPEGIIPGTTPIIPPVENPEPEKQSAPDYLTKYSVTPTMEFYDIFRFEDKIYIRYVIAEVKDAALSELGRVHNSGGIRTISVSTSDSWSSQTRTTMTNTIKETVSWGISGSIGASVSAPVSIGEVGLNLGFGGEYQNVKETTTTNSIETVVSIAHGKNISYEIDLTPYPIDNKYYRAVMKGDCLIVQTLVYDLNKQKLETSRNIIDCIVVGVPDLRIETSGYEDKFVIPESYSSGVSTVTSVDLTGILPGSGTSGSPYLISNEEECLYVIMNPSAYYRLTEDIEMDDSQWFDFEKHASRIDLNGYHLYTPGSEYNPYLISSADDFMKIYGNKASDHYKLTADIDLTQCRLPTEKTVFSGVLDGNNHRITSHSGEDILIGKEEYKQEQYFGLFSENHGIIKNLKLQGITVKSDKMQSGKWVYMGCLAGQNSGTISNVIATDCHIESLRCGSSIGMLVGINTESGSIENCKVNGGLVYGRGDGGGIVGRNCGDIMSVTVTGNGISGGSAEDYCFMHYVNQPRLTGGNSGQGRCWGAITGHADSNSDIRDVIVEDVLIYAEISGSTDKCYLGYIVGYNKGGKVLGSCIIDNCDNDLGGVNLIIKDTVKMQQCWFEVGNGAAGKNTSEHVPSDWKT